MGYAIFTARKLMLTNRINQLNFRIMQLSQQQQTLADNAARAEMAMSNMKNLFSSIGGMINMGLTTSQSALSNNLMKQMQAAGQDPSTTGNTATALTSALMPYTTAQQNVANLFGIIQQSLDIQNQAQLKQVKEMENNIELQRKSLETQVKAATAELQEVEKAEDNQIKNSAPKFA